MDLIKRLFRPFERQKPANCLNIYPKELGGVKFEYMANPTGMKRKYNKDGKWYHVHLFSSEGVASELIFPDTAFYNPKEMAQVVGAEPFRRFFESSSPLMEKIAPWALVGACGLCLFGLILFGGQ